MNTTPQELALDFYKRATPETSIDDVIVILYEIFNPVLTAYSRKYAVNGNPLADSDALMGDMLEKLVIVVQQEWNKYRNRKGEFWKLVWTSLKNTALTSRRNVVKPYKNKSNSESISLELIDIYDIEAALLSIDHSLNFQIEDFLQMLGIDEQLLIRAVMDCDEQLLSLMQIYVNQHGDTNRTFTNIPMQVIEQRFKWSHTHTWRVIRNIREMYELYMQGEARMSVPQLQEAVSNSKSNKRLNTLHLKVLNEPMPPNRLEAIQAIVEEIRTEKPLYAVSPEDRSEFKVLVTEMMEGIRNGETCVITAKDGLLEVVMCVWSDEPQEVKPLPKPDEKRKLSTKQWIKKITTRQWQTFNQKTRDMSLEEFVTWAKNEGIELTYNKEKVSKSTKATLTRKVIRTLKIQKFKPEYRTKEAQTKARFIEG